MVVVEPSSLRGRMLSRQASALVADGTAAMAPGPVGGPPAGGCTVRFAVRVTPRPLAVIVALVAAVTVVVVIGKLFVVRPCDTETFAATLAAALLDESATAKPPGGAGSLNVIVPVAPLPPTTLAGATATLARETAGAVPAHAAPAVFAARVWSVPFTLAMCEVAVARKATLAKAKV